MTNKLIFIGLVGAAITIFGVSKGSKINESDTVFQQNIAIKNTILTYSGIIIMSVAFTGLILSKD